VWVDTQTSHRLVERVSFRWQAVELGFMGRRRPDDRRHLLVRQIRFISFWWVSLGVESFIKLYSTIGRHSTGSRQTHYSKKKKSMPMWWLAENAWSVSLFLCLFAGPPAGCGSGSIGFLSRRACVRSFIERILLFTEEIVSLPRE
jgi:hypothetical protein